MLRHTAVLFHLCREESFRNFISLDPGLRCKDGLEVNDYLISTEALEPFLQFSLHGMEHTLLDKGGIIRLNEIDFLLRRSSGSCWCISQCSLKYVGHFE